MILIGIFSGSDTQTASTSANPAKEEVKKEESQEDKAASEAKAKEEAEAKAKAESEKKAKDEAEKKAKAEKEAKKKAEVAAKKKAEEEAKMGKVGQPVKVGDFEYVITTANEVKEIKSDNMYIESKVTTEKFVVIDYTVKNNDK